MEALILEGKILQKNQLQQGESSRGPWKKQDFVIETTEQYPKKVCISAWGEKVDELKSYNENTMVKVAVNIESREYNQKWYTDIKAWKIEPLSSNSGTPTSNKSNSAVTEAGDVLGISFDADDNDDLPF